MWVDFVIAPIIVLIVAWIVTTVIRTFGIFSSVNDNRKAKK